jgi:hypothetical protein
MEISPMRFGFQKQKKWLFDLHYRNLNGKVAAFCHPCTDTTGQPPNKFRFIIMWHENI